MLKAPAAWEKKIPSSIWPKEKYAPSSSLFIKSISLPFILQVLKYWMRWERTSAEAVMWGIYLIFCVAQTEASALAVSASALCQCRKSPDGTGVTSDNLMHFNKKKIIPHIIFINSPMLQLHLSCTRGAHVSSLRTPPLTRPLVFTPPSSCRTPPPCSPVSNTAPCHLALTHSPVPPPPPSLTSSILSASFQDQNNTKKVFFQLQGYPRQLEPWKVPRTTHAGQGTKGWPCGPLKFKGTDSAVICHIQTEQHLLRYSSVCLWVWVCWWCVGVQRRRDTFFPSKQAS